MQLTSFNKFRKQFSDFYDSIKTGHENTKKQSHGGHGIDHDITVAMVAVKIAENEKARPKVWCAAMLHSTDRVVPSHEVKGTMIMHSQHLKHFFNQNDIDEIIEAAFRHSELNQPDQSETQIVLMDADRLANMQGAVIIRGGQFKSEIPAIDFKYLKGHIDPLSTYEKPRNVLDGLRLVIQNYVPQFRTVEGKRLGNVYASKLGEYIKSIENEHEYFDLLNIEI